MFFLKVVKDLHVMKPSNMILLFFLGYSFTVRGEVLNASIERRGLSTPRPVWGPIGGPEVSTTSSHDEFIWRICLLYPEYGNEIGGSRKSSRELEIIWKSYKELELSTCEVTLSWTALCSGEPSGGLGRKGR
jgi:hypothetical protein